MVSISDYAAAAAETAIYPDIHKISYPSLGLVGECAEVTDELLFNADVPPLEIGDALWYVAMVARDCGIDLSDAMKAESFDDIDLKNTLCLDDLCLYAGMLCETAKKALRDDDCKISEGRRHRIKRLLHDIVVMLGKIVQYSPSCESLGVCAELNIAKLRSRKNRGVLKGDGSER